MPIANRRNMSVEVLILNEKKEKVHLFENVCFSGLWRYAKNKDTRYFQYKIRIQTFEEPCKEFLKFSFDCFPYFRECFLEKTAKEIYDSSCVTIDCHEQGIEKAFVALTHVRYIDEYPELVEAWHELVKKEKKDPEWAFCQVHIEPPKSKNSGPGGHGLMYPGMVFGKDADKFNPKTNKDFAKAFESTPMSEARKDWWVGINSEFKKCFKFKGNKEQW